MKEEKVYVSHRIGGILLIILSSLCVFLFFHMFIMGETIAIFPAMFGLVGKLTGAALCCGKFMHLEKARMIKGIYLTQEQVENLEKRIQLPIVNTPVFLKPGELAVYYSQAVRNIGRQNFWGEIVITTHRTIFLSNRHGFEVKHQNITSATSYNNCLSIQSKSTTYVLLTPRVDLTVLAFDGVRTGRIPIANQLGNCEKTHNKAAVHNVFAPDDLTIVDGMDGHEFEHFCADILKKNGFIDVSVTPGSGDQGVDILATKDGIKYAIQCKNYTSSLSNTPVQEVSAGRIFYNCHIGVVLTNSTFTPGAVSLAQATGVLLWDRSTLAKLISTCQSAS